MSVARAARFAAPLAARSVVRRSAAPVAVRACFSASANAEKVDLTTPWRTPGMPPSMTDEKVAALAKESGLEPELVRDPVHHMLALKVGRLMEVFAIPEDERTAWLDSVSISAGYTSMEFCWGNPPPFHTFEELAIIKKVDEE